MISIILYTWQIFGCCGIATYAVASPGPEPGAQDTTAQLPDPFTSIVPDLWPLPLPVTSDHYAKILLNGIKRPSASLQHFACLAQSLKGITLIWSGYLSNKGELGDYCDLHFTCFWGPFHSYQRCKFLTFLKSQKCWIQNHVQLKIQSHQRILSEKCPKTFGVPKNQF